MELKHYLNAMDEKRALKVHFSGADFKNREIYFEDGKRRISMPMSDITSNRQTEAAAVMNFIQRTKVPVLVTKVDMATGNVGVSYRAYRLQEGEIRRSKIDQALENGETVHDELHIYAVRGKGGRSMAIGRLASASDIVAGVWCEDWSTDYIVGLESFVKRGMSVPVVVKRKNDLDHMKVDYFVSRAEAMSDPWQGIEGRFHRGDVVNVHIVARFPSGSRKGKYAGVISGVRDLSCTVELPGESMRYLRVVVGLTYQCNVLSVSESAKSFVVRPFRLCMVNNGEKGESQDGKINDD